MFNPNKTKNAVHPSIKVLALLAPRALDVIAANKAIAGIAAHEATLGPKVGRFTQTRTELMQLMRAYKDLVVLSAVEIAGLDAVTRVWSAHLQIGTTFALEDIGIDAATQAPEGVLDNARNAMEMLKERNELPFAEQAQNELESTYSTAKAAYDAAQRGRVAVQEKQHELRSVAVDVQKELVKLRTVVRIALGRHHRDYQRLRLVVARVDAEVVAETPPQTAVSSAASNGAAQPSASG